MHGPQSETAGFRVIRPSNRVKTQHQISVIIPSFNRSFRVKRAVESVLHHDGDAVGEVVVVDDGSTDGSCDGLESIDSRVRVIRKDNAGAAKARLTGVEQARCDFVSFLDSDDVACHNRASSLLVSLAAHPECVVSFGAIEAEESGRRGIAEELPDAFDESQVCHDAFGALLRVGCFVPSMNLCVRREAALQAAQSQGFFPSANDYDFVLGLAQLGSFVQCPQARIRCERLAEGISLSNKDTQMCYALIAANHRLSQCKRPDSQWKLDFRRRVTKRWPPAFLRSVGGRHYRIAFHIFRIGMRWGLSLENLKTFYWCWDHQRKQARDQGTAAQELGSPGDAAR